MRVCQCALPIYDKDACRKCQSGKCNSQHDENIYSSWPEIEILEETHKLKETHGWHDAVEPWSEVKSHATL